jgi:hypothetical protein
MLVAFTFSEGNTFYFSVFDVLDFSLDLLIFDPFHRSLQVRVVVESDVNEVNIFNKLKIL